MEASHKAEAAQQRAEQQAKETAIKTEATSQVNAAIKAAMAAPATTPKSAAEAGRLGQRISDILKAAALVKHLGPQVAAFAVGMGFPSGLGNGERPAAAKTMPLTQLGLTNVPHLRELADTKGSINAPHRLRFDTTAESPPRWLRTDGVNVPGEVRVRNVLHNTQNNTYEFTRDGEDQPALIWTPIAHPGNSSTHSPATPPEHPGTPGFPATPASPELEIYPEADPEFLDDYILIFPDDSGLEAQYVMFKSPRYLPGKASGQGTNMSGKWSDNLTHEKGAYIPSSIAEKLRGRSFSRFDKFREAFWTEVGRDPELVNQFSPFNQGKLHTGKAPNVKEGESGSRSEVFELHHVWEIQDGGPVYDMDNIILLTSSAHKEITAINRDLRKHQEGKTNEQL